MRYMMKQCNSKSHRQVIAKVNAYIDESIKELVETLNTFDKVCTFNSCQRDQNNLACVDCTYGQEGWDRRRLNQRDFVEMAKFVDKLAKAYSRVAKDNNNPEAGLEAGLSMEIFMDWNGKMDSPTIQLRIPYRNVKKVTSLFSRLRSEFE